MSDEIRASWSWEINLGRTRRGIRRGSSAVVYLGYICCLFVGLSAVP